MTRRVAVTGIGVISPVGNGRAAFWSALVAGQSGIAPLTRFDATTFAAQLAGEVKEAPLLPASVQETAAHDPKTGFLFAAAAEALAQAGIDSLTPDTLLHLGTGLEIFDLNKIIVDGRPDFAAVARRSLGGDGPPLQFPLDTAARLLQQAYGRPGRMLVNCAACAAGAQAVGHGFRAVRSGEWQVAVCGGFDSMLNPLGFGGFQLLGALTTRNDDGERACRPFDAARVGTVLGEGAAVLVLEPLDAARAAGKPVLAEICGYASTLDAHSLSAPDPTGDGAMRAMRSALTDAGLVPEDICHINTHGTGTPLNDRNEAQAIRTVFAGTWERIPVSAIKSMTGHLIGAAGALEAAATVMTLYTGTVPPNPSLQQVGTGCELCHVTAPGTRCDGVYALSNSFGFGGQNAALVFRREETA